MQLTTMLLLVWMHFVADFVFQTDEVALGKSKSNRLLLKHVLIYGIPFLLVGFAYAGVNSAAHFAVDYVTSRVTAELFKQGQRHWFFVVIGFDQAIHMTTLFITYQWMT